MAPLKGLSLKKNLFVAINIWSLRDERPNSLRSMFIEMRTNLQKVLTLTLIVALSFMTIAQGQPRAKSKPQSFDVIIRAALSTTGLVAHLSKPTWESKAIASPPSATWLATAPTIVDAKGLAVAPGFINMLSHSESSLIVDPRSLSELKQGVTTQIFGELSMGPLNDQMKRRLRESQAM